MEELLYGTGNPAKFEYMRECLAPLPIKLLSLRDMPFPPPEAAEVGRSPLENAREKASLYFRVYRVFVFSCDFIEAGHALVPYLPSQLNLAATLYAPGCGSRCVSPGSCKKLRPRI